MNEPWSLFLTVGTTANTTILYEISIAMAQSTRILLSVRYAFSPFEDQGSIIFSIRRSSTMEYLSWNPVGRYHILQVHLFRWCTSTRVSDLPFVTLNLQIEMISSWRIALSVGKTDDIELSTMVMTKLIDHLQSIPLLYDSMMEALRRINLYCEWSTGLIIHIDLLFCLVLIFLPQTSIEFDLSIRRCFLRLPQLQTSVRTGRIRSIINLTFLLSSSGIRGHVLKSREQTKDMILSLKNVLVSRQLAFHRHSQVYQTKSIQVLYQTDLITPWWRRCVRTHHAISPLNTSNPLIIRQYRCAE